METLQEPDGDDARRAAWDQAAGTSLEGRGKRCCREMTVSILILF